MSAQASDICQLAILDRLAILTDVDEVLQAVITRLANRAKTDDEGDDVKLLIQARGSVSRYKELVATCHRDCWRRTAQAGRHPSEHNSITKTV